MAARWCSSRAVGWLALAVLVLPAACKSALVVRKDGGQPADARASDSIADVPGEVATDAAWPLVADAEAGAPEAPKAPGLPAGFRFENHTSQVAYVRVDDPIDCRMQTGTSLGYCSLFGLWCSLRCADIRTAQTCCIACERPEPALYAIPPGGSRTLPWAGNAFIKATGLCSECECQQEVPAQPPVFQASATVYTDYWCDPMPCQSGADGIITMANPRGPSATFPVSLVPPDGSDVVVIDIAELPTLDAGVVPDATVADASPVTDAGPFDRVPGHTFLVAVNTAVPDASVEGRLCKPTGDTELFTVAFSPDGKGVVISPSILSEQGVTTGKLEEQSAALLRYNLDGTFAGGEVVIRPDGSGGLVAELVIFGSGAPVVWCLRAPMTPAPEI